MREAGLPLLFMDAQGEQFLFKASKGVVRKLYPETRRVDIETEDGSYLAQVLVMGPYFPEVHQDGVAPSHVTYLHVRGQADAFCWPETHRRLLGPGDQTTDTQGQSQPERRYFHLHGYIFRVGDITFRITNDSRVLIETEQDDFILLDSATREIHLHAPRMYVGTDTEGNRGEYRQDDSWRMFNPLILLGSENGDRLELLQNIQMILQAMLIQATAQTTITLTAPTITLEGDTAIQCVGPHIKMGSIAGTPEAMVLGNTFQNFLNSFLTLFNAHVHGNVQNGGGTSGAPTTTSPPMTSAQLSDVAHVTKT